MEELVSPTHHLLLFLPVWEMFTSLGAVPLAEL